MADLCSVCEALWREYAAAMWEYLGLNDSPPAALQAAPCRLCLAPRTELRQTVSALKHRILDHESTAHAEPD